MAKASRIRRGDDRICRATLAMDADMKTLGMANTAQYLKHLKTQIPKREQGVELKCSLLLYS